MFLVLVSRPELLREMREGALSQCWDYLIEVNNAKEFEQFKKDQQDDPATVNIAVAAARMFFLNSIALLVGWAVHAVS